MAVGKGQVPGYGPLRWIAFVSGIPERRLWSIMSGETKWVTLATADKIFSGIERPELLKELKLIPNPLWSDNAFAKWHEREEERAGVRRLGDEHYAHLSHDLYALLNEDVLKLLEMAKDEVGSWRQLAFRTGYRERVFRRWRHGGGRADRRRTTIPMKVLDDILTSTGLGHRLSELHWYTVDELVSLGHWKPMVPPYFALDDATEGDRDDDSPDDPDVK